MGLALKVNIIRRPDDKLEIHISDGLTAWAPAARSSWFDQLLQLTQRQLDTVSK